MITIKINRNGTDETYEVSYHPHWVVALFRIVAFCLIFISVVLIGLHLPVVAAISSLVSILLELQARNFMRENLLLLFVQDLIEYTEKGDDE